jgi:hypothetical protein
MKNLCSFAVCQGLQTILGGSFHKNESAKIIFYSRDVGFYSGLYWRTFFYLGKFQKCSYFNKEFLASRRGFYSTPNNPLNHVTRHSAELQTYLAGNLCRDLASPTCAHCICRGSSRCVLCVLELILHKIFRKPEV